MIEIDYYTLGASFLLLSVFLAFQFYRDQKFKKTMVELQKSHKEIKDEFHYHQHEMRLIKSEIVKTNDHLKKIEIRLFSWKGKMTF